MAAQISEAQAAAAMADDQSPVISDTATAAPCSDLSVVVHQVDPDRHQQQQHQEAALVSGNSFASAMQLLEVEVEALQKQHQSLISELGNLAQHLREEEQGLEVVMLQRRDAMLELSHLIDRQLEEQCVLEALARQQLTTRLELAELSQQVEARRDELEELDLQRREARHVAQGELEDLELQVALSKSQQLKQPRLCSEHDRGVVQQQLQLQQCEQKVRATQYPLVHYTLPFLP